MKKKWKKDTIELDDKFNSDFGLVPKAQTMPNKHNMKHVTSKVLCNYSLRSYCALVNVNTHESTIKTFAKSKFV
jgi:hypothetical protein